MTTILHNTGYLSTGGIGTAVDPARLGPLYHGGAPGLVPGDLLVPGHQRKHHDGCPWCEANDRARADGRGYDGHPGTTAASTRVYATEDRLYARFHASLYGRGDLYRVTTCTDDIQHSDEDTIPSIHAPALRIAAVIDRAVLLTPTERRRLTRIWEDADRHAMSPATWHQNLLAERTHQ